MSVKDKDSAIESINKSDVLFWHLFKGGLRVPDIESRSFEECLQEGLRLIEDRLMTKQESMFDYLRESDEESLKVALQKSGVQPQGSLQAQATQLLKRKSTMSKKAEIDKTTYFGRPELWTKEVRGLFQEEDNGGPGSSLIGKILSKIRSQWCRPIGIKYRNAFARASMRKY